MKWKYEIDIAHMWDLASKRKISPEDLGNYIINAISELPIYRIQHEMIEQFFSGLNEDSDWDDFDLEMSFVYDWADENRVWIKK